MDTLLQGIPIVICYTDDLLVTGQTNEEHLQDLKSFSFIEGTRNLVEMVYILTVRDGIPLLL